MSEFTPKSQICEVCHREHGMAIQHTPLQYANAKAVKALQDLDRVTAERDALIKRLDEYKIALCNLTPGGSEYAGDVDACVRYVHDTRSSLIETVKAFKRERDDARNERDIAQLEKKSWEEKCINLCLYFGPMLIQLEDIKRMLVDLPTNQALIEQMIYAVWSRIQDKEVTALRMLMKIDRLSYLAPKRELPDFIKIIDDLQKEVKAAKVAEEQRAAHARIGTCDVCLVEAWEPCNDENEVPMKTAIGTSYWRCKNCRYMELVKLWAEIKMRPAVTQSMCDGPSPYRHQRWVNLDAPNQTAMEGMIDLQLSEAILRTIRLMKKE